VITARVDQTVLGYLGRALSFELSAVQLYSTQARLVASWGLEGPADRLQNEAREEMQHVERIIARMLALGAAPNASQLRPALLGRDLAELLQVDYVFEQELINLYKNAAVYCSRVGDHDDKLFFQGLLEDEQQHATELRQWLADLKGEANDVRQAKPEYQYRTGFDGLK
jgi:bacterioferritin